MHIQENHNKKYTEKKRKDEQKTKTWSEIDQKIMNISHCY